MNSKDIINLVLFFLLACVIVIAAKGGFQSTSFQEIMFNIGMSMLGGLVCGISLYGINFIKFEKSLKADNEHFVTFNANKDMGEQYWIDFINDIGKDSSPLWFVGNRHVTWIDRGLSYRKEVKKKLIERINRALQSPPDTGWEVVIILTDSSAKDKWSEFVETEINPSTNFCSVKPELIRIALIDRSTIPYSIVAHGGSLVVTPYTSQGRAAESPTFEIQRRSEVADLYFQDLERIKNSIQPEQWWFCA